MTDRVHNYITASASTHVARGVTTAPADPAMRGGARGQGAPDQCCAKPKKLPSCVRMLLAYCLKAMTNDPRVLSLAFIHN